MDKKQYIKIDCSKLKFDSCKATTDKNSTYFTQEIPDDRRKLHDSAKSCCS